jgi:hypothetical protein
VSEPDGHEPAAKSPESRDSLDLEPVQRDSRFIVRLVLLTIVGLIAATFVGMKLKGVAANCGSGLIRPGSSVVPAENNDHAGSDAGR